MSSPTLWDGRRSPVTLLGGYLGSGKTSIVNHLLEHSGQRLTVLVNDVGEVNVDAALIAAVHDDTIELTNGCVCCSLVDGLATALETVRSKTDPPDHVLIELSGVAEPGRVVPWTRTPGFRLDGVVVAADADQLRARAADVRLSELVADQLAAADLLVVTKTDLVEAADVASFHLWLRDRSNAAIIAAPYGRVHPAVLLGIGGHEGIAGVPGATDGVLKRRSTGGDDAHGTASSPDEPVGFEVAVRVVHLQRPAQAAVLEALLGTLSLDVLRVKGVIQTTAGTALVQRVGHRCELIESDLRAEGRAGALVIIAVDDAAADEASELLRRQL